MIQIKDNIKVLNEEIDWSYSICEESSEDCKEIYKTDNFFYFITDDIDENEIVQQIKHIQYQFQDDRKQSANNNISPFDVIYFSGSIQQFLKKHESLSDRIIVVDYGAYMNNGTFSFIKEDSFEKITNGAYMTSIFFLTSFLDDKWIKSDLHEVDNPLNVYIGLKSLFNMLKEN